MDENMNTTEAQVQESAVPDAEAVAAEENAAASKPETSVENETGANELNPPNSRNLRKKTQGLPPCAASRRHSSGKNRFSTNS